MPRRQYPYLAYFPDPSRVIGELAGERAQWLRAVALQHGMLTYDIIVQEGLAQPDSPFHQALSQPSATLIYKARKKIVTDFIRGIRFTPRVGPTSSTFRVLVSAMVNGQRQLVPTPWLVQQAPMLQEVTTRAAQFRDAWERHRVAMLALSRLPTNQRYWR